MADEKFEVGDIAQLKSGGPQMTVIAVYNDDDDEPSARCAWFSSGGKDMESLFPLQALNNITSEAGLLTGN